MFPPPTPSQRYPLSFQDLLTQSGVCGPAAAAAAAGRSVCPRNLRPHPDLLNQSAFQQDPQSAL